MKRMAREFPIGICVICGWIHSSGGQSSFVTAFVNFVPSVVKIPARLDRAAGRRVVVRLAMVPLSDLRFRVIPGNQAERVLTARRTIYESELGHHGVDEFDADADHLVAEDKKSKIIAGLRIIGPDQPMEIGQFIDLRHLMRAGKLLAQIGGFFIAPRNRRVGREGVLPLAMLKFTYAFASRKGITDLVLRTHVREMRKLYERGFFVCDESLSFDHPLWGSVYVMRLDLADLVGNPQKKMTPIGRFLTAKLEPNMQVA